MTKTQIHYAFAHAPVGTLFPDDELQWGVQNGDKRVVPVFDEVGSCGDSVFEPRLTNYPFIAKELRMENGIKIYWEKQPPRLAHSS